LPFRDIVQFLIEAHHAVVPLILPRVGRAQSIRLSRCTNDRGRRFLHEAALQLRSIAEIP